MSGHWQGATPPFVAQNVSQDFAPSHTLDAQVREPVPFEPS